MSISAVRQRQPRWQDVGHLGLRWDRFNPGQDDGDQGFKDERARFLAEFQIFPSEVRSVYEQLFPRWEKLLRSRSEVRQWRACGRVAFGAGDTGMLEVGLRLHRTYGVPVIAGSAQKGLVRRFAARVGLADRIDELLGVGGHQGMAAAVAFHDALWVPAANEQPLVIDTITVHHPEYYQDEDVFPADWDSPTPIATLSAQGAFLFAVEGDSRSAALACRLLGSALRADGIGAKTLKGYGRFAVPEKDAIDCNTALRPLFENTPAAPGAHPSQRPAPAIVAPPLLAEYSSERATVIFHPNTGCFEVTIMHGGQSRRAQTPPSPTGLFRGSTADESRTAMEQLKVRCRKKGTVPARIRYTVDGGKIDILGIDFE